MKKKLIAVVLCIVFTLSLFSMSVAAADWSYGGINFKNLDHTTFVNSWEDKGSVRVDGYLYNFTFGYNTWATDEDYVKEVYSENDHNKQYYGYIRNSIKDTAVTNTVTDTDKTGKADVEHTGDYVAIRVYAMTK